nr:hypothetical protein BaRGS_016690 [Batillaria attramentaria]
MCDLITELTHNSNNKKKKKKKTEKKKKKTEKKKKKTEKKKKDCIQIEGEEAGVPGENLRRLARMNGATYEKEKFFARVGLEP